MTVHSRALEGGELVEAAPTFLIFLGTFRDVSLEVMAQVAHLSSRSFMKEFRAKRKIKVRDASAPHSTGTRNVLVCA